MPDTDDTDDYDGPLHPFAADAPRPETDETDAETPFVPTRGRDTRSDSACDDAVPSAPCYGACFVAALREVFSR